MDKVAKAWSSVDSERLRWEKVMPKHRLTCGIQARSLRQIIIAPVAQGLQTLSSAVAAFANFRLGSCVQQLALVTVWIEMSLILSTGVFVVLVMSGVFVVMASWRSQVSVSSLTASADSWHVCRPVWEARTRLTP